VPRPTDEWRQYRADDDARRADGTLSPEEAAAAGLWPDSLIARTDAVLAAFEAEARTVPDSDEAVFGVIERVVVALNDVNAEHGGAGYETDERELLCAYIDEVLTEAGVDVAALAARRGIGRHEITDDWREW
jgi:hypothetical protein